MRPPDNFFDALQNSAPYDSKATVTANRNGRVNVELFSGERIRNVELVGGTAKGETIRLRYVNGRYVALGSGVVGAGSGGGISVTQVVGSTGGGSTGGGSGGPISPADAPWALNKQGDTITGNINVTPGILIDGYDISATFAQLQAQLISVVAEPILTFAPSGTLLNERVLQLTGLGFTTPVDGGAGNGLTYTLQSSSNPGASQSLLATNPFGGVALRRLGLDGLDETGYLIYGRTNTPSYLRGPIRTGGDTGGAQLYSESSILPQMRIAHSQGIFAEFTVGSTGSMTFFATGPNPLLAHIYMVTAGGLSVGGGQPLARLHVFSTTQDHLRLAFDGDAYTIGKTAANGDFTLSNAGAAGNFYFNPVGDMAVGFATGSPGGRIEVRSGTKSQMRWSWDAANYADAQVNGGGNLTFITTGSNMILDLQPTGGLAGAKFLLPRNSYDINIGSPFKKFLTVNAAELLVETLVAFETEATIGGRLLVVNSSPLAGDMLGTATGLNNAQLKYNNMAVGDTIRMEARGKVEWMTVAGGPSANAPYIYTFNRNIDGTGANDWAAGDVVVNTGQAGNGWIDAYSWWSSKGTPIEFIYNKDGATFSANLNQVIAWKLWGDASTPQAGDIVYYGMGGGFWSRINHYLTAANNASFTGALEYWNGSAWVNVIGATATLFNPTTGASSAVTVGAIPATAGQLVVDWSPTGQTGWAKTVINGQNAYWVRWRVVANSTGFATNGVRHVIKGIAQYGPSIVGMQRQSNVFNDFDARWALGNLHGWYDYGRTAYGLAAGNYAGTWLAMDDLNGFRVMNGISRRGWWDPAGNIELGSPVRVRLAANGSGYVSGGNISWDTNGNATVTGTLYVTGGSINTGANILYNSSLGIDTNNDGVPDGWGPYNNAGGANPVTLSIQPTGGSDGGSFFRIAWSVANSSTKGIIADVPAIKGGFKPLATYVVSWYAKASGTSVGQGMGLYWNVNPTSTTYLTAPLLTTAWQRYSVRITWGATVDPNLFISIVWGGLTTGTLDLDQIQVEEGPALTYWKPSADELLPGSINAQMINVGSLSAIKADLGTIYAGDIRLGNQDANTFNGNTFTGLRLYKGGSAYQLVGTLNGVPQAYFDSDGKIKAGAGNVVLDQNGINLLSYNTAVFGGNSAVRFTSGSTVVGDISSDVNNTGKATLSIIARALGSNTQRGFLIADTGIYSTSTMYLGPVYNITLDSDVLTVYGGLRAREISNLNTPISAGRYDTDYTPTTGKWGANANNFANIVLNAQDVSSIAFHDSGQRVDSIIASGGVITLGFDAGWGAARVNFGGVIGENWQGLSYATSDWYNVGAPYTGLRIKRVGDIVYVNGAFRRQNSIATAFTAIATLPAGYRPAYRAIKAVWINDGSTAKAARCDIETNGVISCETQIAANANTFISAEFWFSTT